ncbi:hypothetical protein LCGC14_1569640 [marine sediment metagenome]|uniref:Uncharacterized protein n=1 Tax=marine sediment metagenome TaxID=412755 RepID=A0A0F9L154_9ZZZZ
MAKAKANARDGLVERIVVGPKPIHALDPDTGARYRAEIGDTVFLSARSAKTFSRYLKDPGVAKAEAAVKAAEEEAAAEGAEDATTTSEAVKVQTTSPKEAPSESEGGGSEES